MPWVEVESELYLPDWLLRMKAKERVKYLMARQAPKAQTVTPEQLATMNGNDKVPGVYAAPPGPKTREPLVIVSQGSMTVDEVRDLDGRIRQGGYGKGPVYKTDGMTKTQWAKAVGNFVDWLVETSESKKKGKFTLGVKQ